MNKLFFILLTSMIAILFTGCGGPYLHTGLSDNVAKGYPLVMIANDDIVCGEHIFEIDAKFAVSTDTSNGNYMNMTDRWREREYFPDHTLFISIDDGSSIGVIVYPNGKFVYEGGGLAWVAAYNTKNGDDEIVFWAYDPEVICQFKSDIPFSPKRN